MEKKRILIVDDDPDTSFILKEDLEKDGQYEVFQESKGLRAMDAVRRTRPDIVLLDVMIPDLDGPSIAFEIEKVYRSRIRIVFISSLISIEEASRPAVGHYPYISKESSLAEIKAILDGICFIA